LSAFDPEALLQEIAPDQPCGDDLEYDRAFLALGDKVKGAPEQQIGDHIVPAEPPNWKEVRKDALDLLRRTRDLRLILFLTQALIQTDGLPGLRDGLALLEGAVCRFWPDLYPLLDPDDGYDPTQRVNLLMGFCDFESVLRPLALAPLVDARTVGRFSLRDIQFATDRLPVPEGGVKPDLAVIRAAFTAQDPEARNALSAAVDGSLASLEAIESFVTDQVGVGAAPSLAPLVNLLKEMRQAFADHAGVRGPGGNASGTPEVEENLPAELGIASQSTGSPPAIVSMAGINNRQDVVRALDLIGDYYARCEPSSPIPLLLQRAKRLVSMSFIEIIKDLAPDGLAQVEILKGRDSDSEY
jgi:type VI secretion system protein ImpA